MITVRERMTEMLNFESLPPFVWHYLDTVHIMSALRVNERLLSY